MSIMRPLAGWCLCVVSIIGCGTCADPVAVLPVMSRTVSVVAAAIVASVRVVTVAFWCECVPDKSVLPKGKTPSLSRRGSAIHRKDEQAVRTSASAYPVGTPGKVDVALLA